MICPRCKNEVPLLYPVRGGHACAACKQPPPAPRPPAPLRLLRGQPQRFSRRRRPIGRIAVLKLITQDIQAEIDWILRRDPELRALKFHAAVYAYRKAIKIVNRRQVIFSTP